MTSKRIKIHELMLHNKRPNQLQVEIKIKCRRTDIFLENGLYLGSGQRSILLSVGAKSKALPEDPADGKQRGQHLARCR